MRRKGVGDKSLLKIVKICLVHVYILGIFQIFIFIIFRKGWKLFVQLLQLLLFTYFVTYHRWPVAFNFISLLGTVISWKMARFSLRKNVSGIHKSRHFPSPNLISFVVPSGGSNTNLGSLHACRRYMLTE